MYERDDYEQALQLMAAGALPLAEMITAVQPLDRITAAFQGLEGNAEAMKVLIDCRA